MLVFLMICVIVGSVVSLQGHFKVSWKGEQASLGAEILPIGWRFPLPTRRASGLKVHPHGTTFPL